MNLNQRLAAIERRARSIISFQKRQERAEAALAPSDQWADIRKSVAGQPGFDAEGYLLPDTFPPPRQFGDADGGEHETEYEVEEKASPAPTRTPTH